MLHLTQVKLAMFFYVICPQRTRECVVLSLNASENCCRDDQGSREGCDMVRVRAWASLAADEADVAARDAWQKPDSASWRWGRLCYSRRQRICGGDNRGALDVLDYLKHGINLSAHTTQTEITWDITSFGGKHLSPDVSLVFTKLKQIRNTT